MSQRQFPIMRDHGQRVDERIPKSIPWEIIAPHESQARYNHGGQSLERLAERGGLAFKEAWFILHDKSYSYKKEEQPEIGQFLALVKARTEEARRTPFESAWQNELADLQHIGRVAGSRIWNAADGSRAWEQAGWHCLCGSGGNNIADVAHHVATCAIAGMNAPGGER